MLPQFPQFKPLEITDKSDIEAITTQYPPYSDFNFASMWSYDTDNQAEISQLNNNLIIKFPDYITSEMFLSFLGTNAPTETAQILLNYASQANLSDKLQLVPESVISTLPDNHLLTVTEDHDNHDYILSVPEHVSLENSYYHKRRNSIKHFQKENASKFNLRLFDIAQPSTQQILLEIFNRWQTSRHKSNEKTTHELNAIKKLFVGSPELKAQTLILFIDDQPVGFSIYEPTHEQHSVIHFQKGDANFTGIFEYLTHQTAIHLDKLGCLYINYEQDLGIDGLRKTKLFHRPIHYLKKYIIMAKQNIVTDHGSLTTNQKAPTLK